jgi:hypothetical protein
MRSHLHPALSSTSSRVAVLAVAAAIGLAACSTSGGGSGQDAADVSVSEPADGAAEVPGDSVARPATYIFPDPPGVSTEDIAAANAAVDRIVTGVNGGFLDPMGVAELAASGDARHGCWSPRSRR